MAFNNTNLTQDSEKSRVTFLDTSNDNSTNYADAGVADKVGSAAGTGLGAVFGGPIGAMIGSALGNVVGTGVNYITSEAHADKQFERQVDLQDRAFQLNQAAQRYQAQNEKHSLERAGMNSSQASANGAPTIQPGAAGLASSQIANIFDGLTELIVAAKAPSEISKIKAEEGKIGAEIDKIGSEIGKIESETGKIGAESEEIQHRNFDWTSYNEFMKENGPQLFAKQKEALEDTVVREWTDEFGNKRTESLWDFLSPETQKTYNKLATGQIPITSGNIKAILDDIEIQAKLAEVDNRMVTSMAHTGLLIEKLQDPKALDALLSEEKNNVRKLEQDIEESKSRSTSNYASARLSNAEALKTERSTPDSTQSKQLLEAQVKLLQTQVADKIQAMDQKALQDFQYLWSKGRYGQALGRLGINATQETIDAVKALVPWALAARGVKAAKEGLDIIIPKSNFGSYKFEPSEVFPGDPVHPINSKNWK